jgi:hypothetical protein
MPERDSTARPTSLPAPGEDGTEQVPKIASETLREARLLDFRQACLGVDDGRIPVLLRASLRKQFRNILFLIMPRPAKVTAKQIEWG